MRFNSVSALSRRSCTFAICLLLRSSVHACWPLAQRQGRGLIMQYAVDPQEGEAGPSLIRTLPNKKPRW
ncbi:hypothetical protein GOP47_0021739 [Adiantum capillus-veneris]|uniref:Secreted protein n=1 Tax=Adiantum capillus-veneris TaxID=13818 RepID=A0A9D4U8X2_ADICA|nr:hypothetical protein GOP47_0021739 [Adiantum capillus-veneris]